MINRYIDVQGTLYFCADVNNASIDLKLQCNTIFVYSESYLWKIQIFIAFLSLLVNSHQIYAHIFFNNIYR